MGQTDLRLRSRQMNCEHGHEMRDMGEWPDTSGELAEGGSVVHRWHCLTCNTFHIETVQGKHLIKNPDGSYGIEVDA